jgi:3-deoxy-D-manno-octulosonate 8-phosphate phosphatase (KDO 8-P phosphatase)
MKSYKENLPNITTIMLDVDGVLTDGMVYFLEKDVVRALNSKDGYALQYATRKGYKVFIITGGSSERIKESLEWLGITEVHLKSSDKLKVYEDILQRHDLKDEEIVYMGDDIPDIPVLLRAGISACPQDSAVEVKQRVHYQSPIDGGRGCVRELIEQIMRVQGTWFNEDAFTW